MDSVVAVPMLFWWWPPECPGRGPSGGSMSGGVLPYNGPPDGYLGPPGRAPHRGCLGPQGP